MSGELINSEQSLSSGEDGLPDSASASEGTPLPLAQAIRALPAQYLKVLTKPSVATFAQEMGKANWSMVWVQLIGLGIVSALLDFLRRLLSPVSFAVLRPFVLTTVLSPIIALPLTFFITMGIAYGIAEAFAGRGTFLAQSYVSLLPFVPLTILGQFVIWLNLFVPRPPVSPAVPSTFILFTVITLGMTAFGFALLIYRVVLQVLGIMAVHRLTGGKAAIVIIVPTALILIVNVSASFFVVFALGLLHW